MLRFLLVALCSLLLGVSAWAGARLRQPGIELSDAHLAAKNEHIAVPSFGVLVAVPIDAVSDAPPRLDEGAPGENCQEIMALVVTHWSLIPWWSVPGNAVVYAYDFQQRRTRSSTSTVFRTGLT